MVKIARHKGTKKDYAIKMIIKTVSETTRLHNLRKEHRGFIPIGLRLPVTVFVAKLVLVN